MRHATLVLVCLALAMASCRGGRRPIHPDGALTTGSMSGGLATRMDRGDWMVDRRTKVWKVLESQPGAPAVHIGYLTQTQYKQKRGGTAFRLYDVTTLNRREKIGRIDQMGRAYRFVPRRNQGFAEIDAGLGSLAHSVGAIFQTKQEIQLVPTSERRIAFDLLDKDGDGFLRADELQGTGDRISAADTNGDGSVDFSEFDQVDQL